MPEKTGRNVVRDLDQAAVETRVDVEGKGRFGLGEHLLGQESVRERMGSELKEKVEPAAFAGATALHVSTSCSDCWRPRSTWRRLTHHSTVRRTILSSGSG